MIYFTVSNAIHLNLTSEHRGWVGMNIQVTQATFVLANLRTLQDVRTRGEPLLTV